MESKKMDIRKPVAFAAVVAAFALAANAAEVLANPIWPENFPDAAHDPAMERLPPGSVRPEGWLREQMELQRKGLTGHAEKLYVDIGESDWLTGGKRGGQFAWERGPYYAKGLVALAFALDDEAGPWRFALRDIATGLETVVTTVLRK